MSGIELMRVPAWQDLEWLRHGFSTRPGGISTVYGQVETIGTLNLGWTKEDDPTRVRENRHAFVQALSGQGTSPMRLVTIRQVHSAAVKSVGPEALTGALETPDGKAVLEGDSLITNIPGLLIAVGTADCVPVLVADGAHRAVGAFHAGWRGTASHIVEEGIAAMCGEYGSCPGDLLAAVGPSIGVCCYAVGEDVRQRFTAEFPYAAELFHAQQGTGETVELVVDLWEANRRQLLAAGVPAQNITVVGECTSCARFASGERKFFSHRAEHGHAGRMLNAIGITA